MNFTSDIAADISKALKVHGQYRWFGYAAHHRNLIIKDGFKKVTSAAQVNTVQQNSAAAAANSDH